MPAFITGRDPTSPTFADMASSPHEAWVWEPGSGPEVVIRWSFSPTFVRVYSSDRLLTQVRLAFKTWEEAASTPYGAQSYYRRDNVGWPEFGDLRSIMLHELGHLLGFHHIEAAFENRFYSWDPGPGFVEGSANTSMVMAAFGVPSGSYNHILSHDELLGIGLLYTSGTTTEAPRTLRFQEVPFGESEQLVVTVRSLDGPTGTSAWARAAGFVSSTRSSSGDWRHRIQTGQVRVNQEPRKPIGMRTRFDRWIYRPTTPGTRIESIEIRTRGTNNPDPIEIHPGPFTSVTTARYGPDFKDDLMHTWSGAVGDTSTGVDFGLELDVFDWIVIEGHAGLIDPDGRRRRVPIPLVTFYDFGIVEPDWAPDPPPLPDFALDPDPPVIARGIKIVGAATVARVAMTPVTGVSLLLGDLTKETRARLEGTAAPIESLPQPLELKSVDEEPCLVLLDAKNGGGKEQNSGVMLEHPELLKEEVFVTASFGDESFEAEVATVVGRPVPAPVFLELDDRNLDTGTLRLSVHGGFGFDPTAVDPDTVKVSGAAIGKVDVQGGSDGGARLVVTVRGMSKHKVLRLIGRTKEGATFDASLTL